MNSQTPPTPSAVKIGNRWIGAGQPPFIVAELSASSSLTSFSLQLQLHQRRRLKNV